MENTPDTSGIASGITISSGDGSKPYAQSIVQWLSTIVGGANLNNFKQVLNQLEEAVYASGEIRYGSKPEPEHVVFVRDIMRKYMEEKRPIPVLVPFGSIKAKFNEKLDIAELGAINQMMALQARVIKFYEPGLQMVVRMEDTSGYELFALEDKANDVVKYTEAYIHGFRDLVKILGASSYIHVVFESEMEKSMMFKDEVVRLVPAFYNYLEATDKNGLIEIMEERLIKEMPEFKALMTEGWNGVVPKVQRDHYYRAYGKLYNGDEILMRTRLAMYFAGSLVRHKLDMTGKQSMWTHGFIQLAFVPPIPGIPDGYNKNYIYYRTMPESKCRSHMPPWRAKGYLRINDLTGETKICPKLANWHDPQEYNRMDITITNGDKTVTISADYILETNLKS